MVITSISFDAAVAFDKLATLISMVSSSSKNGSLKASIVISPVTCIAGISMVAPNPILSTVLPIKLETYSDPPTTATDIGLLIFSLEITAAT